MMVMTCAFLSRAAWERELSVWQQTLQKLLQRGGLLEPPHITSGRDISGVVVLFLFLIFLRYLIF
jgi:hypothetical protein